MYPLEQEIQKLSVFANHATDWSIIVRCYLYSISAALPAVLIFMSRLCGGSSPGLQQGRATRNMHKK